MDIKDALKSVIKWYSDQYGMKCTPMHIAERVGFYMFGNFVDDNTKINFINTIIDGGSFIVYSKKDRSMNPIPGFFDPEIIDKHFGKIMKVYDSKVLL